MHQKKNLLSIRNLTDYKTHLLLYLLIAVVQSLSRVWLLVTHELQHARPSWPSLSPRVCSKCTSIESVMPSNHLILCHPLLLPPSIFPSIRVFSNELAACIMWPNHWIVSFSIRLSNWFPLGLTGLIFLLSMGLLRVFSSTTIWKYQFSSAQPSLWSSSHIRMWLLEKP